MYDTVLSYMIWDRENTAETIGNRCGFRERTYEILTSVWHRKHELTPAGRSAPCSPSWSRCRGACGSRHQVSELDSTAEAGESASLAAPDLFWTVLCRAKQALGGPVDQERVGGSFPASSNP